MTSKSALERKQHRDATTVGRDKASTDTIQFLNSLPPKINDSNVAIAIAELHAQINGGHPDHQHPPAEEPFGYWHASLNATVVDVTDITTTEATVNIELTKFELFDTDASLYLRFIEDTDTLDRQVIETPPITMSQTGTNTVSTDSLSPSTKYNVQVVAEASVNTKTITEYSDRVACTTTK